jgi:hypothetical protein
MCVVMCGESMSVESACWWIRAIYMQQKKREKLGVGGEEKQD